MRRTGWLLPVLAVAPLLLVQRVCAAMACAATPEGAVLEALQEKREPGPQGAGFRVRDIVVDPLLHRAFVHVEQCDHPERPLALLPFGSAREVQAKPASVPAPASSVLLEAAPAVSARTVASGSMVAVAMVDEHMRLTMQGRLLESAEVGSEVDVQLASFADGSGQSVETIRRVHGRLIARDRVEVQQ